jgi:hypothetical protein
MPSLETDPGAPNRSNGRLWFPSGLLVVILCTITLAFYHGLWQPGLVLIKRDAFRFYLPLKQYLVERLTAGELPQWFPYEALGRPFIGVAHTGVFHPFTALHLLFSVPDAYRVSTLLSCLLAALGAHALGRALGFSHVGALLAGIAFALSGYVVSLTDNLLYLYSVCLLPLFCLALDNALTGGRVWTIAPAVLWATVFLIGDIQTGYYYAFIAALWLGFRRRASYRETVLRLLLTGGLTVLLAGIQLGPAGSVYANSVRAHQAQIYEQAVEWSTHPLRLLTALASPVWGDTDPADVGRFLFGSRNYGLLWAESLYLGVPVVGLALLGAWSRRDLKVLVLLGSLTLLLALGQYGGLYALFYHVVPFWSAFRYPEKLMGVVAFATAMLAGAGLDALRAERSQPALWIGAAVGCAVLGGALLTDAAYTWIAAAVAAPVALAHAVTTSAGQAFLYSAAATAGVGLILLARPWRSRHELAALGALLAIVTLDLSRANMGAYHTAPAQAVLFTPPFVEALRDRGGDSAPGRFRIISILEKKVVFPPQLRQWLGYAGASSVSLRQALDLEHNAEFHLESAQRYLVYSAVFSALLKQSAGPKAAARYNVAYYIGHRSFLKDPRFAQRLVAELPLYDLALFESPVQPKPRSYLSPHPVFLPSGVEPATAALHPDFLNGETDFVENVEASLPQPSQGGHVAIERYLPETVRIRVRTPQRNLLILADAFDQGWKATIDDAGDIPVLRANVLVRAVIVPAGEHTITFQYETPLLKAGASASLLGCVVCLAMLAYARRQACSSENHP